MLIVKFSVFVVVAEFKCAIKNTQKKVSILEVVKTRVGKDKPHVWLNINSFFSNNNIVYKPTCVMSEDENVKCLKSILICINLRFAKVK